MTDRSIAWVVMSIACLTIAGEKLWNSDWSAGLVAEFPEVAPGQGE